MVMQLDKSLMKVGGFYAQSHEYLQTLSHIAAMLYGHALACSFVFYHRIPYLSAAVVYWFEQFGFTSSLSLWLFEKCLLKHLKSNLFPQYLVSQKKRDTWFVLLKVFTLWFYIRFSFSKIKGTVCWIWKRL